jgi:glycosyltransferase involved in cell wall biosynthesis
MSNKGKILIVENFGFDFWESRKSLALKLIELGYEVHALIPNDGYGEQLGNLGIKVNSYSLNRSNKGIFQIVKLILIYRRLFLREKFDIVHSFRFQPNLISCFSKIGIPKTRLILHITGLGIAFSSNQLKYIFLRWVSQVLYIFKFSVCDKVIVQNPDDLKTLVANRLFSERSIIIEGSGVDMNKFIKSNSNIRGELGLLDADIVFLCITRLIWQKGIAELINSFKSIQRGFEGCKLLIVGWPDFDNPEHIPLSYFESLDKNSNIFFLGKRNDVVNILSGANVYIYPSYYREGIPRSILEALSIGLPVITTDTPGCNLTVVDKKNGLLIAPKSSIMINQALTWVMENKNKLNGMGVQSRILAEKRFSMDKIINQVVDVYSKLIIF